MNIISCINSSILVDEHIHPLIFSLTKTRANYGKLGNAIIEINFYI